MRIKSWGRPSNGFATQNGVRIKSWGRPSNGFTRNILFQHVTIQDVQNPIVIDQNYCPSNEGCPGQVR